MTSPACAQFIMSLSLKAWRALSHPQLRCFVGCHDDSYGWCVCRHVGAQLQEPQPPVGAAQPAVL